MSGPRTALLSVGILGVAAAVTLLFFLTEPEAERGGAVRETAMLVDVTPVEAGDWSPVIRAMGTVEPAQDITLSPRVSGQILRVSPNFVPGGRVDAGEVLAEIDPADFENQLAQLQGDLSQARADLEVELGRQDVARQDLRLLGDSIAQTDRALVLREPQVAAARARVEGAEAAVEQARLALERTRIRAPFDAQVLTRTANVGSQVSPGDALGRLVGRDTYWVVATVPQNQLRWLTFPARGEPGSPVRIRNRTAWEADEFREGTLHRLVGALEAQTRLARVIVEVPDPLLTARDGPVAPPLLVGAFVEAEIQAEALDDVIRLDRDHLRADDTVWVMEDGVLRIRDVDVAFRDAEYVYIRDGLSPDARVVTTSLASVRDGAPLRLPESGGESARDGAANARDGIDSGEATQ